MLDALRYSAFCRNDGQDVGWLGEEGGGGQAGWGGSPA